MKGTIYTFGTNSIDTYLYPHSEVVVALNAAKGFQAAGHKTVALWGGKSCIFEGVQHEHFMQARPTANDLLLIMHPFIATSIATEERFAHLRQAGIRWLFTNGYYSENHCKAWASLFHRVFVEGEGHVSAIQQKMPNIPVHYLMLGCSHDLDFDALPSDPYPQDGCRHLFIAGRISSPGKLQALCASLPSNYRVWCASQQITLAGTMLLNIGKNGESSLRILSNIRPESVMVNEEVGKAAFAGVVTDPKFTYIGSLPFGTFHHFHYHSFASLDFGYARLPETISCKIIDAMRAGARILADGYGRSYEFIAKYDAGATVPHGDWKKAVEVLNGWKAEDLQTKRIRALMFRDGESWHSRILNTLEYLHEDIGKYQC